ncbi:hypothetical protein M0R45_025998 [Rubus argutus]|uniref:Uncharacterized protein n=1 Tax=Rubus argutus TaxID=59490 RepID=A0AAW1WVN5_RUBAR
MAVQIYYEVQQPDPLLGSPQKRQPKAAQCQDRLHNLRSPYSLIPCDPVGFLYSRSQESLTHQLSRASTSGWHESRLLTMSTFRVRCPPPNCRYKKFKELTG